jgi:CubicO group peptidase (beta-lactamase class C family)
VRLEGREATHPLRPSRGRLARDRRSGEVAFGGSDSTLAPAWEADKRPVYGAFFWINGTGALPVPREAYYMSGAGGQTALIVPSHDLVVVRLGHFNGSTPGTAGFRRALALLMEAVPSGQATR